MNKIKIDTGRVIGVIDRNIFGGFAEHLGRCIYGGIYEEGSHLADEHGLRTDVLNALRRLRFPIIRYPGGNFASGYRWMDGIGPLSERPARLDLAWKGLETNRFGTNEFIRLCRKLDAEPYIVVNCGDGDMREARDWVEYCNGTQDSALVNMRHKHGFEKPHQVKYWGIGNEVDGPWQIGYKTPEEYTRAFTEFGKVMKWVDPNIKLIASAVSDWGGAFIERTESLLEQAGDLIDYLALHWYVGNPDNDFATYMATSEIMKERLTAYEGIISAFGLKKDIRRPIAIAVDEWNVWYRTHPRYGGIPKENGLEEIYNLEDALVVGLHLNAFIRHSYSVRMANIAQVVNVIAPIFTSPKGILLQTIFYPFELYSTTCGEVALDVTWQGETFSSGQYSGVRFLDVSATLDRSEKQLVVYAVNRSETNAMETQIELMYGSFLENGRALVVNGPHIKAENTFGTPDQVKVQETTPLNGGTTCTYMFEPHSVTALICKIG
ncbi:alpha-N-arabinofuranosidase [Thermodesulfobacteriota bacterium]